MKKYTNRSTIDRKEEERLQRIDRLSLIIGIGFSLFCVLGFGLVIFAFQYAKTPPGWGAQTPIIPPEFPRHLVDFSLIDQSGRPFTRKNLDGKIVVVNFICTGCTIVCPHVNAQMEKIQELTVGQQDVKLVSVTMNPIDDTAPILAQYGRSFNEDESRWSFLTGYELEMRRFVGTSFLPPDTTGEFGHMPGNFAHTQWIALVDSKGHLVEYFDGLNQDAAEAVAQEISKLRNSP